MRRRRQHDRLRQAATQLDEIRRGRQKRLMHDQQIGIETIPNQPVRRIECRHANVVRGALGHQQMLERSDRYITTDDDDAKLGIAAHPGSPSALHKTRCGVELFRAEPW